MAVRIVTGSGNTLQSYEEWKKGGTGSTGGSAVTSDRHVVSGSGAALQTYDEWRNQKDSDDSMFSSGSRLHRNQDDDLQNQWLKKYQGKGYESLASSLRNLEEGEEKNWLREYAQKVDYDEKMALDLDAYEAGIQDLLKQYDTYKNAKQGDITAAPGKTAQETLMDLLKETGIEIDRRKQYLTLAKRLQEQAAGQEQYSQVTRNADFAQKSGYDSGNQEIGYQYMNADAAGKLDLEQKYGQYAKQFADRGFDSLSEDEKAIYNYYMNTGDRDEAARYLKYLEETLQIRKGTEADAYVDALVEDNPKANALRYAFMANVGYDQHLSGLQGAGNLMAGKDEYVPATATQVAGQLVREDLGQQGKQLPAWLGGGSTGQMLGDLISTTANMAPSMVMGLVSPNAGAAMMGVSAAGGAYQEKINEGFTKEQARKYGIAIGASEAALGAALGGIKSLGGAVTNHVVDNALKGIKNGVGRFFAEWGTRIGSEALEEGIQEILTPMFSNLLLNTDEKVDWSEVAYSALLGGLSAGVLEVGDAYSGAKKATADNKAAVAKNATTEESTAVGDKMSATQLTEDIDSFAKQYGKQAGAVKQNYLEGQDLQEYEVGFQAAYAIGKEGGSKEGLQKVQYLSQAQKDIAFSMGQHAAAVEKRDAEKARVQKMPKATLMSQDGESGPVSIAEVVSMDDDAMTFRLEDGSTVTDDALTFDKGQQVLSAVWETGMDVEAANAILADMEANPATDADQAAGIDEAYRYGSHGYSMEQLIKNGTDAAALTENQRKAAYDAGVNARQAAAVAAPAAKTEKSTTSTGVYLDSGSGNVTAFSQKELKGLTGKRKAGVQAAMALQKIGVGGNFYFYESYVNEAGERVYKDAKGVEKEAPNGWYDPKDDSIHIDLNAGGDASGLTLYTLSHELTHFVEKRSKEKHRALADFLAESYGKQGESVDALVIAKQKALSESRGEAVSYEEAYSEFIADSMEAMLSDGNVLEKLADLKTKDRSLFDEIRKFFDNLVKKIRDIYAQLVPDSEEGKMVLQMKDQIEQIQQLFAEALAEADSDYPAAEAVGINVDSETESVAPAIQFSERTWKESDYVQERNKAAAEIAQAIGVTEKKARDYIDSINSIAKMIAEDRTRLDYFSSPYRSSFVSNVEYGGSFDFSTLCKKRRLLTGTFTAIQKALPNTALTANEILDIRNRMKDAGLEVSCGLCYVEGSRANMGQFAKEFLRLYKQYYPDAWQPNMADVNTPDGIEWVRINHPECYEQYEYFWNHYGTLKPGDKNLFASQQKPKLYQLHTEYKGEILQKFKGDDTVEEKNRNGGIRLQSFSDFEIVHLIDTMQIIMDMSRVGLAGQAYTKVPDFAWALGDTGLKINLSLIAKGVDENGKLIFDDVEGMPIAEAMQLRDRYSANVGTILVAFNDEQLMAAMADDRVDFIIPFHRSQWKKSQYEAMGLPAKTKDYTYMQNEKFIKPQYHEYRGRMVKDKATNYMPNEYWDFSKSGKENAIAYLEMCARNNKRPKFYKLLQNNGDGSYSLKADGSTDGYWKLLIDFKMYDNDGKGSPQMAVKPEFNMEESTRMLEEYRGGHSAFPVAQGIVDAFVGEYKQKHDGRQLSERVSGSSNRALLAGAFEELVRSPEELKFMQDYRENVELLNAEEEKLQELRMQIRELTFGKGRKDPAKLAELQAQAETVAKEIDRYDRKLLKLETAKPLRDVLARERQKAEKKANQKKQEAVAEYREKRQESAARKEARKKIRRTVFELEKLLNRGDKKKNVKAGMNAMVSSSLKLADALFMDEYSNRDMIRNGVGVQLTDAEEQAMREAQRLLGQIESGAALEGMEFASEIEAMEQLKKLDSRLSAKTAALKDVFARERKRLYGTQVSELIGKLAEEYSALSEAEDGAVRAAKDENVYAHLLQLQKDVKNVTVRDMSLEQLKMVADAYTMVLTTVRNANKMFAKNLQFKRDALAGMVMNEVSAAAKKVSKLVKPGKNLKDSFSWNNLKPVYAFERLGSETLKTLYGNIRKGQDVWSRDMQEADAFRRAQYKKHGWKKWDPEKLHKFEFESGIVELNLGQIMSLYAYSRREAAMDHLIKGGFVFDRNTEVVVKENGIKRRYLKKDATAYNLTADELLTVIGTLSKEQKAFVEDMQTYLSDVMGGKGNEVSLKMYGIRSFGEKNYFPLRSARQYMEKAKEDSFRKEQGQISIANSGFTKAVTPHASNPITLDGFMDVWSEHVNEMSMYHGFVLPMEDFRRVYNYSSPNVEVGNSKSVNAAIENTFGEAATGYIDQLYKDLNGGAVSDNRETIGKKLVGLHKKAAVFASWSVVIQQPSAFVRSFSLIDPKYFMGAKVDRKRHEQLWAELKEYAPVAFVKEMGYFDTGMGRSAKDYLQAEEYSGIREKMTALLTDEAYRDEQLGKAPALADEYTWSMIWEAVKRETKARNPGMDVRSREFLQTAGDRFSEVIDKTQVYDSVLSRSANMRSKSLHMNMLTSFLAEPTTSINMLEDALRKGDRQQLKRTVGAVYGSVLLNSLLVSLVYAARDDDEEKTFWEKYLSSVAVEVLDGINPVTYYPVMRDIWSIGQGFDVERADMSLISDFANEAKNVAAAIKEVTNAAEEEEEAAMAQLKKALWGLTDSVAGLAGLPVKNIRRDIESVRNVADTISKDLAGRKTTKMSLKDAVLADVMNAIPIGNLLYEKSRRDRLYYAAVGRDQAYAERLKAGYSDEAAYHSAVKMALRDHDSRIWEAAMAWNSNDLTRYMELVREIIGEGNFIQDDVVLAIRAEASAMEDSGTASASQKKGYFTGEKFGVAMGQNNTAMADIIRQDLIDTKVVNGKTRAEAEESVESTARSQLKELYELGEITGAVAQNMLVRYGGYDREDAKEKVAEWKYEADYPELEGRITYSQYKRWEADGKSRGVSLESFTKVTEYRGGDTSEGVRSQEDVAAYINAMPISTAQKDALWCCFWSEKTLYKNAPWH